MQNSRRSCGNGISIDMNTTVKIIVKGVVQGVGFRWFVQREANKLGLMGYVKNLHTSEVEIVVQGETGLIEDFMKIVRTGNRLSRVTGLDVEKLADLSQYQHFTILF